MSVAEEKKQLRQELRVRLDTLSAGERQRAAAQACALLKQQVVWSGSRAVFFYSPLPNELHVWALVPEALQSGKIVLLPRFDAETNSYLPCRITDPEGDLLPGRFGIQEPRDICPKFPLNKLDLALVPGVGFDLFGRRLGRGRGFYDRLLAEMNGIKCGVAFDEQIVERIPIEAHDVRLNCILTPTRWIQV
jgi:5-formyltetrahydrofolate cyclo-ligase